MNAPATSATTLLPATEVEWCVDNEDIDGRNGCASDEECMNIGRSICDPDPNCFGIAWYPKLVTQPLKICKSTVMGPKTDGWRTMMKQGVYTISFYQTIFFVIV